MVIERQVCISFFLTLYEIIENENLVYLLEINTFPAAISAVGFLDLKVLGNNTKCLW